MARPRSIGGRLCTIATIVAVGFLLGATARPIGVCAGGAVAPPPPAPPPAGCGHRTVAIVVDPTLVQSLRAGLDQFESDLCAAGYDIAEHSAGFATPPALRTYLQRVFRKSAGRLAGAILIGDLPHAYQFVTRSSANPAFPSSSEEAISFQYYADLNGVFAKSPGYTSPAGHQYSYDVHSGNVAWEIWVGVLPLYKGDRARTVAAITRYFGKNHAYRSGQLARPNVFLQVNEHFVATTLAQHNATLAGMQSGQYAWTPYSNSPGARLYFESPPGGLSVHQGYADMRAGVADFAVTDTHGFWGASGQLTIAAVESSPVRTLFFWSNGCAIGDLDHADNFLASVLYGPTSDVLIAKGTTNDSGGMGNNANGFFGHNIATALSSGSSLGDAVLSHVNVPLIPPWSGDREFHYGTPVILGDPTLLRLSTGGADLVPLRKLDVPGPIGFCRIVKSGSAQGKLLVTVTNQGNAAAPASTCVVQFGQAGSFTLSTPAIPAGGSVDLAPLVIPGACFRPDCSFKIIVDSGGQVTESNEANNVASGICIG